MAMDTRALAARALGEVLKGKSLNQVLPAALAKASPRDRGLLQQLCYGTLRQAPRLIAILDRMLDKPLREKDSDVRGLLLCGLYQLEDTRIPDHAAVSATVAATRGLKKPWAKGMTNAVLRRFLRERDELTKDLEPAAEQCHPQWLLEAMEQQWPDQSAQIIAANNSQPPMTLRINTTRGDRQGYLDSLSELDIAARPGSISPEAIYLDTPSDVAALPGFEEGQVSVQDEAAQLAALVLQCEPGDRVLDACAAPGGKSCHILESQPELDELVAMDLDPQRLVRVEENLERLGHSARLLQGDGSQPPPELEAQSFDRILVDAPCSATGVIRRHPDVKVLRRAEDIASMGQQQVEILQGLWPLLKPGGILLYATCSILEGENDKTVEQFLRTQADARPLNPELDWGQATRFGRQVLPAPDGPDGLFYALLEKQPRD